MLHFVDTSGDLVQELRRVFHGVGDVVCSDGDILAVARNAIVSPANSYGFMDGGIDAAYSAFFGPRLQNAVQEAISRRPEGHLPVGASLAVRTGHERIPFVIVAPTMLTPEEVPADNCYRAMRAVLRLMRDEPEVGREVFCPGLATGVGRVPPAEAAEKMFRAYDDWMVGEVNRCPLCGGRLFRAVPRQTTVQEIRQFFAEAQVFGRGEDDPERDWIHPGTYCYSCNYGTLAHYVLPGEAAVDERPHIVTITSPGPNRVAVLSEIRKATALSPAEAIALFEDGQPVVIERPWNAADEVNDLIRRLTEMGAVVMRSRKSPEDA